MLQVLLFCAAVVVIGAIIILGVISPVKICPECGRPLPKIRLPKGKRQAVWGGWTCPNCGCEIDRDGRKI